MACPRDKAGLSPRCSEFKGVQSSGSHHREFPIAPLDASRGDPAVLSVDLRDTVKSDTVLLGSSEQGMWATGGAASGSRVVREPRGSAARSSLCFWIGSTWAAGWGRAPAPTGEGPQRYVRSPAMASLPPCHACA